MTDSELLTEYSRAHSQEAFAGLVNRYMRLVYSACRRQLGDGQLAEDATQTVFLLLSQKAARLRHTELSGWLLTSARYTCANLNRREQRQREREKRVTVNAIPHHSDSDLLELLDDGLLQLRSADRAALMLRFLQEQPLRQVGKSLGLSEDAARKRVERALEKLRRFFHDHGLRADSATLAAALAQRTQLGVSEALRQRIIQHGVAHGIAALPRLSPAARQSSIIHHGILHSIAAASTSGGAMIAAAVTALAVIGVVGYGVVRTTAKAAVPASIHLAAPATGPIHSAAWRQRETAARIKCGGQMRQIGLASLDYASKHNGNFPADFGSLVITEEISPELFICPDSHTSIPPDLDNRSLEEKAIWVDQHSDYIYRGKGLKNTCDPNTLLAYEKDSDHVDGMTMLWADGHVDYNRLDMAHKYIQKGSG